jgi:hypothetical protein
MSSSLQIGPFALPWALLLMVLAVVAGNTLGRRVGRAQGIDPEPQAFRVLLLALLVARLAFVWPYRGLYLDEPWRLIDIRDGGWNAQAGLIAGWIATAVWVHRRPLRRSLLASVGLASLVWLIGSGLLLWQRPADQRLPALTLSDLQGRPVALAGLAGRPTVVNLWATWCPPCRREMPVLAAAQGGTPGALRLREPGRTARHRAGLSGQPGPAPRPGAHRPALRAGRRPGPACPAHHRLSGCPGPGGDAAHRRALPATLADKLGALGPALPLPSSAPPP